MKKYIFMARVFDSYIIESFLYSKDLMKALLLISFASKINMRNYIEYHQEVQVPNRALI